MGNGAGVPPSVGVTKKGHQPKEIETDRGNIYHGNNLS